MGEDLQAAWPRDETYRLAQAVDPRCWRSDLTHALSSSFSKDCGSSDDFFGGQNTSVADLQAASAI
jgi:hypothetical protein